MRRLVMLVVAMAALSVASPAASAQTVKPPPPLYFVIVQDNGAGECLPLPYGDGPAQLNQYMNWDDQFPGDVTVVEIHGFWSFPMSDGDSIDMRMVEAGTFREHCGGPRADVSVAPYAAASTTNPNFGVRWATPHSPADHIYLVKYKMGSHGTVHNWKTETTQKGAVFPGHHGHAYFFSAMSAIDRDHHTDWSPWIRVVVH
jgi:hypothetical protein